MFEFTIRPDDADEYKVTATSRDFYVFERTTKGRSFADVGTNLHMADMYKLAHLASKRQQLFNGTLDEFASSCDIDFEEEEEPDPTQPEALA
jgi:hypothetical protein